MTSKNNSVDKYSKPPFFYEVVEKKVLEELLERGYCSPYEDDALSRTLKYKTYVDGVLVDARRFLKEFLGLLHENLEWSQVRKEEINVDYCTDSLAPLLEKAGKIMNPVMVEKLSEFLYKIVHGHGRIYSSRLLWREKPVPCLVLTGVFIQDENGNWIESKSDSFSKTISQIGCNAPPPNKPYEMADVSNQLENLYSQDPTFGSLNPSGQYPRSPKFDRGGIFDKIMDFLHPNQFLKDGIRTKIYNAWVSGKSKQLLTIDMDYENGVLKKHGICDGTYLNNKGKLTRKKFMNHYDPHRDALIAVVKDNGFNADQDLLGSLFRGLPTGEVLAKNIIVFCTVKNPEKHLGGLTTARNAFLERMKKINGIYAHLGIDQRIVKLIMPKQLKDNQDKGVVCGEDELGENK